MPLRIVQRGGVVGVSVEVLAVKKKLEVIIIKKLLVWVKTDWDIEPRSYRRILVNWR